MKKIAIIAALAASIAAPAFAQSSSTAFAIAHFNQSADRASDVIDYQGNANTTQVTLSGSGRLSNAFDMFNATAESQGDLRGLVNVTVAESTPSRAQAIFAELRAASLEDE